MSEGCPPLPIFPQNAFADRVSGIRTTISSTGAHGIPVVQESEGGSLSLRAEDVTDFVQLWLSRPSVIGNRR